MKVLLRVIVKEFQQLRRDKRMIPAMIIGPVIQLLTLGYAANNDVTDIPMVLLDDDHGVASRALVDRFTASKYFRLVGAVAGESDIEPQLVRGNAQVALVIPPGFGRDVAAGRSPRVQLIVDGSDSTSAVVGLSYAARIVSAAGGLPEASAGVELASRIWYNPDLRSRWFYVPAILAMVLMLIYVGGRETKLLHLSAMKDVLVAGRNIRANMIIDAAIRGFGLEYGQDVDLSPDGCEAIIDRIASEMTVDRAAVIHTLRIAVTGRTVGPGLFELLKNCVCSGRKELSQ
jgi:hypothetical protein